jgi:beta-galactosidase GanA
MLDVKGGKHNRKTYTSFLVIQQVNKGGNIIMVQVENEYSSYATDKPYVAAVRDLVRESGFTDVPLFQVCTFIALSSIRNWCQIR